MKIPKSHKSKQRQSTATLKTAVTAFLVVVMAVVVGCGDKKSADKTTTTSTTKGFAQSLPKTQEKSAKDTTTSYVPPYGRPHRRDMTTTPETSAKKAKPGTSTTGKKPVGTVKVFAAAISLRSSKVGEVLFSDNDQALYAFAPDINGTSTCYGECATVWSPLLANANADSKKSAQPKAGTGVQASLFDTTKRRDGSEQVTYGGHPLYIYTGDSAGQIKGQDLNLNGGVWHLVSADGKLNTK